MKKLSALKAGEVSMVPEGANRRRFLIWKSKDGAPGSKVQQLLAAADPALMDKVNAILEAAFGPAPAAQPNPQGQAAPAGPAVPPAATPPANPVVGQAPAPVAPGAATPAPTPQNPAVQGAAAAGSPAEAAAAQATGQIQPDEMEQAKHALQAVVRIMTPWKDKISPKILQDVLSVAGFGGGGSEDPAADADSDPAAPGEPTDKDKDPMADKDSKDSNAAPGAADDKDKKVEKSHMEEAMKAANTAYAASLEKLGYSKFPELNQVGKAAPQPNKEGVNVDKETVVKSADGKLDLTSVPEAARGLVETIYKGQQEAIQKAADLEKKLNEQVAANEKRELVAKAAGWSHLGLKQEDVVAALQDASKVSPEALERITKQYDAMNEQAKTSATFREIGSNQGGHAKGDAEGKIDQAVEQIVQKSAGAMSKEQAYSQFLETSEGQKLYAEFKAGRKDGI